MAGSIWRGHWWSVAKSTAVISYFLHINKNGGSTIRHRLGLAFPASCLYEFMLHGRIAPEGQAKTPMILDSETDHHLTEVWKRQRRLSLVIGNMSFGIHQFIDVPVRYHCFLRNPIARCTSYWFDLYNNRHRSSLWQAIELHDRDLVSFLSAPCSLPFRNDQVRLISGVAAQEIGLNEFYIACSNIDEHFGVVGLADTYETSWFKLAKELNIRNFDSTAIKNVGRYTTDAALPEKAKSLFEESNYWDIRLIEWVLKRTPVSPPQRTRGDGG